MAADVIRAATKAVKEIPGLQVVYTDALSPESYHLSRKPEASVLFLHPIHRARVDQIQRGEGQAATQEDIPGEAEENDPPKLRAL